MHSEVDALIFVPFLYSRVHCCAGDILPAKYNVRYPQTATVYNRNSSVLEACDLPELPRDSVGWSHSRCGYFICVQNRRRRLDRIRITCSDLNRSDLLAVGLCAAPVS